MRRCDYPRLAGRGDPADSLALSKQISALIVIFRLPIRLSVMKEGPG
jgi:hypothetical protein